MLEGLSIKEVTLKNILLTIDFRLEAEFHISDRLKSGEYYLGEEILKLAQYNSSYGLNDIGAGYSILRMNEFDGIFTGTPKMHFDKISKERFEELKLSEGDILICRTNGNPKLIGKSAISLKNYPFIYESHLFKIRVKEELTNAAFIVVFLNTKYGRLEIDKFSMVGNQANFSIARFKELRIPKFDKKFNDTIKRLVYHSFELNEKSKLLYQQAETHLLLAVGLQNFQPTNDNVNVKTFIDSFLTTGRLDAEYYQKKYEEVISHITKQKHSRLANIVTIKKSIEPGSNNYSDNEGLPFYRVSDYNKMGLSEPDKKLTNSFIIENKEKIEKLIPKKDTILFAKDGSVGTAYLLRKDLDGITSGAILQLNIKNKVQIIPEYLTLALNSKLVQMQAERDAGGSIILHWRKEEIENVIVPIIDITTQQQIAELVEESFRLKKESDELLELAKRMVEVAIEQGEERAIKLLKDNTN